MIYQYMYARKRDGFGQLNDWSGTPFTQDDVAAMQSLRRYQPTPGMDVSDLPECRYFHNARLSFGRVGVLGRTTFVPAGSSRESGERETTFVHKYVFTGSDYEALLANPARIFQVDRFCGRVEEAGEYAGAAVAAEALGFGARAAVPPETPGLGMRAVVSTESPVMVVRSLAREESQAPDWRDVVPTETTADTNVICSLHGIPVEEVPHDLLRAFGMDEDDFLHFLYAFVEASGGVGRRVYVMLPSNDAAGARLAWRFCCLLFSGLPDYLTANSGFITYADTFHDSTGNNLPGPVTLVFTADTDANALKLPAAAAGSPVFHARLGLMPRQEMDLYTLEMLTALRDAMLGGRKTPQYVEWFKYLQEHADPDANYPPEALAAGFQFHRVDCALQRGSVFVDPAQLAYILHEFLGDRAHVSSQIEQDVVRFMQRLLLLKSSQEELLSYILELFGIHDGLDETLTARACDLCVEAAGSENRMARLKLVLERLAGKSQALLNTVVARLYAEPAYAATAGVLVAMNLHEWLLADRSPFEKRVSGVFDSLGQLHDHYPELVSSAEFTPFIHDIVRWMMAIRVPADKSGYGLDELLAVYLKTREMATAQPAFEPYLAEARRLAHARLALLDMSELEEGEERTLDKWRSTGLLKELGTSQSETVQRKLEIKYRTRFAILFRDSDFEEILRRLNEHSLAELEDGWVEFGDRAINRISSQSRIMDKLDQMNVALFNLALFHIAYNRNGGMRICEAVLRRQGISALRELYLHLERGVQVLRSVPEIDMDAVRQIMQESVEKTGMTGLQQDRMTEGAAENARFLKDVLGIDSSGRLPGYGANPFGKK